MSIYYTVRPCDNGELPLVDRDWDEDDISDYIDQINLQPRGMRAQNRTMLVRVCKKPLTNNTQLVNTSGQNVTDDKSEGSGAEGQSRCRLKKVTVTSLEGEQPTTVVEEEIPEDVMEEIEIDGEWRVSQNKSEPGGEGVIRQRRQAEGNGTDDDISSGASEDEGTGVEIGEQAVENKTDTVAKVKAEERGEMSSENNGTKGELEESNEISMNSHPTLNKEVSTVDLTSSEEMDRNYIQAEPERLKVDLMDVEHNYTAENNHTAEINLSFDYDDYSQEVLFSVCLLSTFIKCL